MHAVDERGLFTGNRGCLVDESSRLVRHHAGNLWITCRTSFRDWRHPLDAAHRWTPLFFLDDAVALAAGHRPCAVCRREDYRAYREAVTRSFGRSEPVHAAELDRRLAGERLRRGAGLERRQHRLTWSASIDELPDGTVIIGAGADPRVVVGARTFAFAFGGWTSPDVRPTATDVEVVTPPTSVGALRHGFAPVLHPSLGG